MSIRMWHWYSVDHAQSAVFFATMARELETSLPEPTDEERSVGFTSSRTAAWQHRSYAIASVFASVAFLEAVINEVVASAGPDGTSEVGGVLPDSEREKLTAVADGPRLPMLHRYEKVLQLLDRPPFDRGAQPYQDAALLERLRNALVHYEPRWRSAGGSDDSDIETFAAALQTKGFGLNPFTGAGNPFFPDQCLTAECAAWGFASARALADELHARLGVETVYRRLLDD